MVTKEVVQYLKNNKISKEKRVEYLASLDLSYSDLFYLSQECLGDDSYNIVYKLLMRRQSKIYTDIDKQNRKNLSKIKQRRIKITSKKNW